MSFPDLSRYPAVVTAKQLAQDWNRVSALM
jgi:hypothetical protein